MTWLIDTNVAIHVRDGNRDITLRIIDLGEPPTMSLVSLIELQGGLVIKDADEAMQRKRRLSEMLREIEVIEIDRRVVDLYGTLVMRLGFSRRRILDRLIAATAIVRDVTLVTMNGADFRDIPDLKLQVWPVPDQ